MNTENIDKVIDILLRARDRRALYMPNIQSRSSYGMIYGNDIPKDEATFVARNNKASLLGLVALSPEWREDGGTMDRSGRPQRHTTVNGQSLHVCAQTCMEDWLGLQGTTISAIFIGYDHRFVDDRLELYYFDLIYDTEWLKVTEGEIIAVLRDLKNIGEIEWLKKLRAKITALNLRELTWTQALQTRIDATIRILERMALFP